MGVIFAIADFFCFCQIDRNLSAADKGGGGQHDDQQYQHDVHEGDDVDLINVSLHGVPCGGRGSRPLSVGARCS